MSSNQNKPIRIVLIDDDPVSRTIIEECLKPEGYKIITAESGVGLLEKLPVYQPDVLLMDVLMPGVNGFELCRKIKNDKHWQHVPIVLVTSLNRDQELVEGLDAGADEFISKPVSATELRARVRSMYRVKQRVDLLIQMSQMREDLAHMVVHDIRTPLSVCVMRTTFMLDMMKKGRMKEPQLNPAQPSFSLEKSLGVVKSQLNAMNLQVDDILLMAKTEQDQIVLHKTAFDMYELLHKSVADHRELAMRDEINIHLSAPHHCRKSIDVNLFRRMISNLISNAVKFAPPRSDIFVCLRERKGQCLLEVIDQGPGIAIHDRERIFDRYAIASTESKNVRSIGLGLAFCKMVAEAHGGKISVHDNVPHGALFRIEISN